MQFVGLLLIVNSLVGGAWWIATGRPQLVAAPLCIAALAGGVYLMAHSRSPEGGSLNSPELQELTKETAKAKTLLADLQDQTAAADWHLKQLDEHIRSTKILPDGRTRVGNTVMGQAVLLIPKLETLQKIGLGKPVEAYPLAVECVGIYEDAGEQAKGAALSSGDLDPETIAWLYATAASAAQGMGEHDRGLEWARLAVKTRPTTERQCLLVTALINKNLQQEADALIRQEIKAGGPEAVKFRTFLDQYKIPYKRTY